MSGEVHESRVCLCVYLYVPVYFFSFVQYVCVCVCVCVEMVLHTFCAASGGTEDSTGLMHQSEMEHPVNGHTTRYTSNTH